MPSPETILPLSGMFRRCVLISNRHGLELRAVAAGELHADGPAAVRRSRTAAPPVHLVRLPDLSWSPKCLVAASLLLLIRIWQPLVSRGYPPFQDAEPIVVCTHDRYDLRWEVKLSAVQKMAETFADIVQAALAAPPENPDEDVVANISALYTAEAAGEGGQAVETLLTPVGNVGGYSGVGRCSNGCAVGWSLHDIWPGANTMYCSVLHQTLWRECKTSNRQSPTRTAGKHMTSDSDFAHVSPDAGTAYIVMLAIDSLLAIVGGLEALTLEAVTAPDGAAGKRSS